MSHSHDHDHSDPTHTHDHGPPQQQQQRPPQPVADPVLQAAIDENFHAVPLKLGENTSQAVCAGHGLETCAECGMDFQQLNMMAKIMTSLPAEMPVPPPPNVMAPHRSQAVTKAKEDGNALYKQGKHAQAVQMYSMAANIAASRPPWEASALARDELAIVICNRSAACAMAGDHIQSLVDAELVINLKKPWSKGHFRKGKALLALGRPYEARDAIGLGLQFEPTNQEMLTFMAEIEKEIHNLKPSKSAAATPTVTDGGAIAA